MRLLAKAGTDQLNVYNFTLHPGELVGNPLDHFLTKMIDPLAAAG